jgi:HSP20 family protein
MATEIATEWGRKTLAELSILRTRIQAMLKDVMEPGESLEERQHRYRHEHEKSERVVELSLAWDVDESDGQFTITCDLPGVRPKAVKIELYNNEIRIFGERLRTSAPSTKIHHRAERTFGVFMKSFSFPPGTRVEGYSTVWDNGVLTIEVPKV